MRPARLLYIIENKLGTAGSHGSADIFEQVFFFLGLFRFPYSGVSMVEGPPFPPSPPWNSDFSGLAFPVIYEFSSLGGGVFDKSWLMQFPFFFFLQCTGPAHVGEHPPVYEWCVFAVLQRMAICVNFFGFG